MIQDAFQKTLENWSNMASFSAGFQRNENLFHLDLPKEKKKQTKQPTFMRGPIQPFPDKLPGLFYGGLDARSHNGMKKLISARLNLIVDASNIPHRKTAPENVRTVICEIQDRLCNSLFPIIASTLPAIHASMKDGACLIHCEKGRSRSVSIVAAYCMRFQKISLKDALQVCTKLRPTQLNSRFLFELSLLEELWLGHRSYLMQSKVLERLQRQINVDEIVIPENLGLPVREHLTSIS